jgi:protein MpaA
MTFFLRVLAVLTALTISSSAFSAGPCDDFYARLPNVQRALCENAKLQATAARSVKGRTLYVRDVHPQGEGFRVLVIGGIHGDELSSTSVALHWIGLAQAELPQTQWRFIPALNPDGLFSRPSRRVNANGVDLNRNFPTPNWAREAPVYWEKRTGKDPRRWPGKKALSEPESQFLVEEIQRFNPHLVVSIHAPYGVLDFDGPIAPPSRLGGLYLDQVGIFPGSLGNYGGIQKGMPVITIELTSALKTPSDAEMQRMWQDLRQWMSRTLKPSQPVPGLKQAAG